MFLLLPGLVVGNGTWVVSEGCEIRDTSLGTWLSLSDEIEGTPVPKPEVKEEPQWLHTPSPHPPRSCQNRKSGWQVLGGAEQD